MKRITQSMINPNSKHVTIDKNENPTDDNFFNDAGGAHD